MTRIAMLGLGSMNGAILAGMLASGTDPQTVEATTGSAASAREAAERHGITVTAGEDNPEANRQAAARADIVVLGVKPKAIVALAREIAEALRPETVVVSIAAGVTAETLASVLPEGQPLVRTMPNTPLTVGAGVVGVAPGPTVTEEQAAAVESLFTGAGETFRVTEDLLPAVVAAAGSAPAYAYLLAEAIADRATQMGLDREAAERMAAQTVKGAGIMMLTQDIPAEQLRRKVMSPGGTTEQAVLTLQEGGFEALVASAMDAAASRDRAMGEEFGA